MIGVGDVVVCVDASVWPTEHPDSLWHWPLRLGAIYRVTEVDKDIAGNIVINLNVDPPEYVAIWGWSV